MSGPISVRAASATSAATKASATSAWTKIRSAEVRICPALAKAPAAAWAAAHPGSTPASTISASLPPSSSTAFLSCAAQTPAIFPPRLHRPGLQDERDVGIGHQGRARPAVAVEGDEHALRDARAIGGRHPRPASERRPRDLHGRVCRHGRARGDLADPLPRAGVQDGDGLAGQGGQSFVTSTALGPLGPCSSS